MTHDCAETEASATRERVSAQADCVGGSHSSPTDVKAIIRTPGHGGLLLQGVVTSPVRVSSTQIVLNTPNSVLQRPFVILETIHHDHLPRNRNPIPVARSPNTLTPLRTLRIQPHSDLHPFALFPDSGPLLAMVQVYCGEEYTNCSRVAVNCQHHLRLYTILHTFHIGLQVRRARSLFRS